MADNRLYSHSTGGCYLPGVHSEIPADAVPITEERYLAVIASAAPGKVRGHDAEGLPILVDPPPASYEELAAIERAWRDGQLASSQWLVTRHRDELDIAMPTTLNNAQYTELLNYRQALRDWPESDLFPSAIDRPAAPTWVGTQTQ